MSNKVKAYKGFVEDVKDLYGEDVKVYGPYKRKSDKRRFVLILQGGDSLTKLYARVKLEIKLGRILSRDETVDHIDENPLNDRFSNLQLLSLSGNASKSSYRSYKWKKGYKQSPEHRRDGEKNGQAQFTNKQVRKIRKALKKGLVTYNYLFRTLGVSPGTLRNLLSGRSYVAAGGPLCLIKSTGGKGRPKSGVKNSIEIIWM